MCKSELCVDLILLLSAEDDTVVLGLEPLHGILLGQLVGVANLVNLLTPGIYSIYCLAY